VATHYLIDYPYQFDERRRYGIMGHLLVFNPGGRDASCRITVYREDREPVTFPFAAPARASSETNYAAWPIEPGCHVALAVEADRPVCCQATVGWNNSLNDYSPAARTLSPHGVREAVTSYLAITRLSRDWYLPDGIVIDMRDRLWVRESEWAIVLNPGDRDAAVTISTFSADARTMTVTVPARRLARVYMDDVAKRNEHYGARISADRPVAAQWVREIRWFDGDELMSVWSVPCAASPA
jgi:hypothetical protein